MTPSLSDPFLPAVALWVYGGISLLAALGLTPLVVRLARWRGWIDQPSDDRWHDRPVALLGGLALAGAIGMGVGIGGTSVLPWPVWAGGGLMFAAGLADDLWGLRPDGKLLVQVVAAAGLLYAGYAFWPGGPAWASVPLTFLWVIGVTNALNLIDGIDGLAASITTVAAGALVFMSVVLGKPDLAVVMTALGAAALGFLAYNAPPARIFMGDCGSFVLGYLLAVGTLGVQAGGGPIVGTLVPIAVLAVPLFDTAFVTVTRLLRGQPVTRGGTDHVHHRLIQLGASEGEAVAVLAGTSAAFGTMALSALWMGPSLVLAVAALCLVGGAVVGVYLASTDDSVAWDDSPSSPGVTQQIGAFMRAFAGGSAWKSVAGMLADLLVVGAAFVVAVHLRYGGAPPPDWSALMVQVLPAVIGVKLFVFYVLGLYEGIWRHAGTPEVVRLIGASAVGSLLVGGGLAVVGKGGNGVLSVFVLDGLIATVGVGGTRFAFRALRQYVAAHRNGGRRVLLYGSGTDGMLLLRHLRHHPELGRTVVGLLDDDPDRHGYRVQGVEVLGGSEALSPLCTEYEVEEVIVPVQSTSEAERRRVRDRCEAAGVDCKYFASTLQSASGQEAPTLLGNGASEASLSS